MPIRRELRPLYPPNWPELSRQVRFERAGGVCQKCGRPHGARIRCLPDGRWFDAARRRPGATAAAARSLARSRGDGRRSRHTRVDAGGRAPRS